MAQYKTKGIIIRRRNFGEADRILTIYTERRGKVSAIAKGVRKPLSKLAGHLELFYLTDFHLAEGKNLHTITGAILINDFPAIRNNPQKINQMYYIAELIDKLIHEHERSEEIFALVNNIFQELNTQDSSLLLAYFELRLISYLGHKPELNHCVRCREKLSDGKNFWDHSSGVICAKCLNLGSAKEISNNIIKLLRLFLEKDVNIINNLNLDKKTEQELKNIIYDFLRYHTEFEPKSRKYLKNL